MSEPYPLVGEAWRGVARWRGALRPVAVTRTGCNTETWIWLPPMGERTDSTWGAARGEEAASILLGWALHLEAETDHHRERADKAEASLARIEAMKRNWGQP